MLFVAQKGEMIAALQRITFANPPGLCKKTKRVEVKVGRGKREM